MLPLAPTWRQGSRRPDGRRRPTPGEPGGGHWTWEWGSKPSGKLLTHLWDRASRGVRALAVAASGVDDAWSRSVRSVPLPCMVNPFTHRIETASRLLATSEPSAANARLQVTRMTCDLAGPLLATRLLSDRPRFERVDRAGHGCFLTDDAPRVLRKATDVNTGFRYARIHDTQPPR